MKAWSCEHCDAETKGENPPGFCPICGKKGKFQEIDLPDPTEQDKAFTEKYEEVIETIEKYEEGTPPRRMTDASCCGVDHDGKEHKKHD